MKVLFMLLNTLLFSNYCRAESIVMHRIPAALAMEGVVAAVSACVQKGAHVTATVIDLDAQRIATLRGDLAGVHTYDASWGKAYTAVGFAPLLGLRSSGDVGRRVAQINAAQPAGTTPVQPPEHMIFRAGGLAILLGDEVIGAIGVGGADTGDKDEDCARSGLDRILEGLKS